MVDDSSSPSDLEPMFIDVVIIIALLALWFIALSVGLFLGELLISAGSFLFLILAVVIRIRGEKVPYRVEEDWKPQFPPMWRIKVPTPTLPCALIVGVAAAVPAVAAYGLVLYVMFSFRKGDGVEPGLDAFAEGLTFIVIIILLLVISVFSSISWAFLSHSKFMNDKRSKLAVLIGLLLGGIFLAFIYLTVRSL